MYREPSGETLMEYREGPGASRRPIGSPNPLAYPAPSRWSIADRAPGPADTDPACLDRTAPID